MNRQAPNKAVIVPIEKGRRRRPKPRSAPDQRTARRRISPLAIIVVGLIAACVLALAIRAIAARLATNEGLAAATGTGMATVVGLAAVAALVYVKRANFARRAKPGSGPSRSGPRKGIFNR